MACLEIPKPQNWRRGYAVHDEPVANEYEGCMTPLFATLLVWGCSESTVDLAPTPSSETSAATAQKATGSPKMDSDGDGTNDVDDCAPNDRYSFPGAVEHCDGADNDCDGTIDFGTHALRLLPGDALETRAPAPQLGPGRGPLTVSLRIRIEGQADTPIQWLGDDVGYALTFADTRNFPRAIVVSDDPANTHETNDRDSLLPNRWTHVAFVLQPGSKETGAKIVLYLDGNRYSPETLVSTFDFLDLSADNHLRLTAAGATDAVWIDELRFWSRTANRTSILPKMCDDLDGDEPELLAYFPFEIDMQDHGPHKLEVQVTSGTPQLLPF